MLRLLHAGPAMSAKPPTVKEKAPQLNNNRPKTSGRSHDNVIVVQLNVHHNTTQ